MDVVIATSAVSHSNRVILLLKPPHYIVRVLCVQCPMCMKVNNLGKAVQVAGSDEIPLDWDHYLVEEEGLVNDSRGVCLSFTAYVTHQLLLCIRKNDEDTEGQTF